MKLFKKDIFNYLILLVLPVLSYGDFDNSNPQISTVFSRGPLLIYDCNGKNTVCASSKSFELCSQSNPKSAPCKLIKRFEQESQCKSLQLDLVSSKYDGVFCSVD